MYTIAAAILLVPAAVYAQAEADPFAGMPRVAGRVTAVRGATLTVKAQDGAIYQVVATDNTRVMRARGVAAGEGNGSSGEMARVRDLHAGDSVMAIGNLDGRTLHAAMIGSMGAAETQAIHDNLGRSFIAGRVIAVDVDRARMTVQRPDGAAQIIGFDETTSFRRGSAEGESLTLAAIRPGDSVSGQGTVRNGTFVPGQLIVRSGQRRAPGASPPPR